MDIEITLTTRITIPDGSVIETGPTGAIIGFRMPCDRLVRPWISLEIEEDDDNRDLGYDEQMALGIDASSSDVERHIDEI